ncbi:hypothetical protein NEOLEDRAFT_1072556 [Neolentinus lepideus HHB14362 ss-1]|uniref:C2H2-type domain-containing protein n=1 Tax=Neolentinus lepideus HHB14362 ss-1 TaxID=1314782 RepID=A0A165Q4E8_9AGAM|nr:hypothetical protein NEOLEDRAFT_1072556 [Neolentinus lepideus HHB14362 ss-1]
MRRRLPSGSYKLCNCILNLRRQNESKKHIVAHILELKGQGLTGEHIKCPWPECTQYAKLENLARHISHVHLRLNFLCRFCGKSLARKDALKRHCASQHPNMIHGDFPLGEDQDEDEPEEAAPMEGCVQEQSAAEHVQQAEITQQAQQDGVIYIQAQQEEVVQEQAQQEQQEQQEGPEGQAQQEEVAQVLTQQGYDHDQSNDGSVQHGTDAAA